MKRIAQHRDANQIDRLDVETTAFHRRVHQGYMKLIAANRDRFIRIDATQPIETVVENTKKVIRQIAGEFFNEES